MSEEPKKSIFDKSWFKKLMLVVLLGGGAETADQAGLVDSISIWLKRQETTQQMILDIKKNTEEQMFLSRMQKIMIDSGAVLIKQLIDYQKLTDSLDKTIQRQSFRIGILSNMIEANMKDTSFTSPYATYHRLKIDRFGGTWVLIEDTFYYAVYVPMRRNYYYQGYDEKRRYLGKK